jgi:DNA-binding Lrp family transcriptional regulator
MEPLLKLLENNAALRPDQLAVLLDLPEADVIAQIKAAEANQTILSYRAVLNEEKLGIDKVRAVIEVRITPEREGGFDRLAERVAQFTEVRSCYLMSGDYDLLVVVEGDNLRQAAAFVSEKLAPLHGIVSTVTHFILKPYKLEGVLMKEVGAPERLAVAP